MNALLSEKIAVVATIDPDAYTTGVQSSDYVDMADFEKVMFIVQVGTLGSLATVDFKLQEAKDTSATGLQDISGKSITQMTAAGTDSDKQAIVEISAPELSEGYRYVKGVMTIGVAASDASMVAVAGDPKYSPVAAFDLASVDEIVS